MRSGWLTDLQQLAVRPPETAASTALARPAVLAPLLPHRPPFFLRRDLKVYPKPQPSVEVARAVEVRGHS